MTESGSLQDLRDFTVQIRNAETNAIIGTGIAVSTDGKVVTCKHVIEAAGIDPRNANDAEVGVYFPRARGGEEKNRRATIAKYFPDHDDDIVLLQLTSGPPPLAPEQIVVIGTTDKSDRHEFRSYGYRPLPPYVGGWADGTIMGSVESPEHLKLQVEPVQLKSQQIAEGMSGSGVFDMERNLLVGIVSETYYPRSNDPKDRDTAWSVNARVLSLAPLGLVIQEESLPLRAAAQPRPPFGISQLRPKQEQLLVNAPQPLDEWVGRVDLLESITADWLNSDRRITGLIGFGGEGKSSLARRWLEELLKDKSKPQPDGVFWWGLYENRSVDDFFEAALKYITGEAIAPQDIRSSSAKAHQIAAVLANGRFLFILDGMEVLQHQEGDQYGSFQSNDLSEFLGYIATSRHQSFCLITSRAPLSDLMKYKTYTQHDVDRLSKEDGCALLKRLGVKGTDVQLDKVVADWDGHALTLSLVGSYLVKQHKGDVRFADKIRLGEKKWEKDAPEQYKHVSRILRRYDEHLSAAEKAFLLLFSAFRIPIHSTAFKTVFRKKTSTSALNEPLTKLRRPQFDALVERLVKYRIIRHDAQSDTYTAHPLIRNHYFALLIRRTGKRGNVTRANVKLAHEQIKDYYLSIAGDTPQYPTLDDLKPLIEVVHHACQAGAYDEADSIRWERIDQRTRKVFIRQLGAYETQLALMLEFFPDRDASQNPQVSDAANKYWILNEIGFCLTSLGRLREAVPFYERANVIQLAQKIWNNASITYQNLSELHAHMGALEASAEAARQALDLAHREENKFDEAASGAFRGWAEHLRGNRKYAEKAFKQAEKDYQQGHSTKKYLYGSSSIQHADYLRRTKQSAYARRVTVTNLEICERNHWRETTSQCHRVIGDLDADSGDYTSAREHYESALKIARGSSARFVLIEALLARGRWQAKHPKDANAAFTDLNEALGYCVESGYRIHEADVRVALAWAYLANDEKQKARGFAERALQMSNEMGYHWGKVDAKEVLDVIARSGEESKSTRRASQNKTKAASKSKGKR